MITLAVKPSVLIQLVMSRIKILAKRFSGDRTFPILKSPLFSLKPTNLFTKGWSGSVMSLFDIYYVSLTNYLTFI